MSRAALLFNAAALISGGVSALLVAWLLSRCLSKNGAGQTVADLGRWLLGVLPPTVVDRLARRLIQADLDGRFGVEGWIGLQLLVIAAALSGALLVAAAGQGAAAGLVLALGFLLVMASALFIRRRRQDCERRLLKELPAYLDAMTVCVEAGATLHLALRIAVDKASPSPARRVFERVLREIRMGRSRVDALNLVAQLQDIEALSTLVSALVQSESHGMSLGSVLRAQSQQRAAERQLRAEKAAMKAPVKMLGPLVLCVFPCTFIVIAVPVVVRMFLEGR